MASKKYTLLVGLLCLIVSASFSQTNTTYDMRDSSLIPAKKLPQYNEFNQNAYAFPAQPLGLRPGFAAEVKEPAAAPVARRLDTPCSPAVPATFRSQLPRVHQRFAQA